jgi:hypothetical protein
MGNVFLLIWAINMEFSTIEVECQMFTYMITESSLCINIEFKLKECNTWLSHTAELTVSNFNLAFL